MPFSEPNAHNGYLAEHAALLIASYHRATGKDLVQPGPSGEEDARALFEAPYAVVSHDTEADPIFNYGNRTALQVFELSWPEFTRLPSRESAAPMNRSERARLLAGVSERGFIDNYRGVRISSTGRRFTIEDATVWNVVDANGVYCGQAAVFYRWLDC